MSKKHSGSGDNGHSKDRSLLLLKPDGRFNTVHLLPVFLNVKESSISLAKPSIFNNEMQLSAEDRLHKLIHTREKIGKKGDFETEHSEIFHFFPRVVVFQNFNPGKVYKVPLSVRNACQVIKPLQITYEESQYFSVSFTSGLYTRIAPGMSTILMLHFSPEDKKDYSYQISLQSNKESFNVPVIAVGPRPLLDFPDDIHIPAGPIKIRCTKVVLVRNIGDIPAIFSLSTMSPFDVEPRKGVLRPSEMMNVRISVTPKIHGNVQGQLKICYETGEILYSQIYGIGEEANVWMDKSSITIDETYIGVKQMTSITLHNDSNHLLNFKWKKMATIEDEFTEYDKLMNGYSFLRNLGSQKYSQMSKGDIVDPETHTQVYNRMYDDEVKAIKNEEFLFNHESFSLKPLSGDIWPKSSIDIIVMFEPNESGKHSTTAYCDIPGHDQRLPLIINGFVKGPQFAFNLDVLDIDCVFVSKPHCYEVVVKNVGLIPGTITFHPSTTRFGGKISCDPETIGLMPEECKTFLLTFSSNVQGEFFENVLFKVVESGDIVQIDLKGFVVTPTLIFDETSIDFGLVPFSFPTSHVVLLQNLSMVEVNFKISMRGDGVEPCISYKQYAAVKDKPRFPRNPKEYQITPSRGVIAAYSSIKVKITLTGNVNREKKTTLVLNILDAISEPVTVPISHKVTFPFISSSPSEINIRFCFLGYPYTRSLILENTSDITGFFYIIPQPLSASNTLLFSAPLSHGIIKPHSKMKIPITILTNHLGMQTTTVSMLTLGEDAPHKICTLYGSGQGPVMTAEPHILDYGNVTLLEYVTKEFVLTNDSPVSANFTISSVKKNTPWEVSPLSGILPAEKNIVVEVTIYLRDIGKYKDTLHIEVFGSRTLQVILSADGVGTSLKITPLLCPTFDLGYVLTNKYIERRFNISNEGSRNHDIVWSNLPLIREPSRSKRYKKDEPEPIVRKTVFHFSPESMNLPGRHATSLIVRGYSDKAKEVIEEFFCHATWPNKKEVLLSTVIKAKFIDPKVVFSVPEVSFKIDMEPGDKYKIVHEKVEMKNATDLAYKTQLRTEHPFLLMGKNGPEQSLSIALNRLATVELTIIFDSSCVNDLYSRKFRNFLYVTYREHIHMDLLPLIGEVNFPNMNVFPDVLDFGCIPVGAAASETFEMVNEGHLPVKYHWYWLPADKVDYANECRQKNNEESTHPDSVISIEEIPQDDKSLESDSLLDKLEGEEIGEGELDSKEMKRRKRKRVPKISEGDIKDVLFPIIAQFFEEDTEEQALQCLPDTIKEVEPENKYFDVSPWNGELQPLEVQTISVVFSGDEPTVQCAVLVCKVDGGPSQVILVRGEISELNFTLDKTVIDVENQIFCTTSLHEINLTNVGNLPFDFLIKLNDEEDITEAKSESDQLKVVPISGKLVPSQNQVFNIHFTPGVIKKLHEPFIIQVGFLDPVFITVKGYGVIPQLYAFLPRPKSYSAAIDIGYEAIDLLLEEYLLREESRRRKKITEKIIDQSLFGRNISKRELKALVNNGWTVITYEDQYPTVAEVDLTIEKLLAQDHIEHCSYEYLKHWSKSQPIPGLQFPPYEIDFGIVIIETSVSYSALLYNYGPIAVTGNFQYNPKKYVLTDQGFTFKMPNISKLNIDQTVSMQILFNPTRYVYQEKRQEIEFLIYLEIAYGAKIPIHVHAIVTVPYLITSDLSIDFETIKCGEQKTITISLTNEGSVPCTWHYGIKGKKRNCYGVNFPEIMSTVLPQQTLDLDVIFKPSSPGQRENILVLTIEDNAEKLEIQLSGIAVEPCVTISDQVLQFEPTLPYPEQYMKSFKVKNTCNCALEFYLPHLDSQIIEEEKILRVLCDYYQTDRICLPVRNVGEELPKELTQFYQMMVALLKSLDSTTKKKRKRSRQEKPKVPSSSASQTSNLMSASQISVTSDAPQLQIDPTEEALHEHMDEIRQKLKNSPNNDPVQSLNNAVKNEDTSGETVSAAEGLLLIFHGAPDTDSLFCARKTEKALNLKLLNIDEILLEAAATSTQSEAIKLRDKINSLYADISQLPGAISKGDILDKEDVVEYGEEEESEDDELDDLPAEDPVEEMKTKVKCILNQGKRRKSDVLSTNAPRGQSKKEGSTRTSTVASQQSYRRASKKQVAMEGGSGTIPGITVDVYEEIIKKKFSNPECFQGVVIDRLNSMFFDSNVMALASLLRAVGFIKYIHLILFYKTFEQFEEIKKSERSAGDEADRLSNDKKLALFETLTVEEIEELSEEEQALYWSIMMEKRKEDWLAKKNETKKGKKKDKRGSKATKKGQSKKRNKSQDTSNTNVPVAPENAKKKGKKGGKGAGKAKNEPEIPEPPDPAMEELMNAQLAYNSFESEYNDIITIAMNWDKRKGAISTPSSKTSPKHKSHRKSNVQNLQLSQRLSVLENGSQSIRASEADPEHSKEEPIVTWIFSNEIPNDHRDDLMIGFLMANEEFNSSRPEPSLVAKQRPTTLNWCVSKPEVRDKILGLEEFIFCNHEEVEDSTERMHKAKTARRKSARKKADLDANSEASKVKSRWILNPGEEVEIKVQFDPHSVGQYMSTYPLEVMGCSKEQSIIAHGICDLPGIDMNPSVIFDHVVPNKERDKLYRLTFFLDKDYFDFGAILVTRPKDKRLHHIATSFKIFNHSPLKAEVRFSFLDKTFDKVDAFAIEPVLLNIPAGCTDKITVFATPRSLGSVSETIICSITDNPALERIKIACTGVKVDFEVEPKSISFEHILVFRKDFRTVKLKNKSLVPVIWHLVGLDDAFLEQFDISSTEGLIMPLDDQDIRIEFFATQVVSMKKNIKVEVFDEEGRGDPVSIESIHISAESVDVVVDISFSDPRKNYVEFGKVKVGSESTQTFYMKNRGKHVVVYRLEVDIPENARNLNISKTLSVKPSSGSLYPGEKGSPIEVVCRPHIELQLRALPVFKCYLFDRQNIVATIPIQVSVSVHRCSYEISPKPEVNFGAIPIGSKRILPLTIKNTGVWEISYTISKLGKIEDDTGMVSESIIASAVNESIKTRRESQFDKKTEKDEHASLLKSKVKSSRLERMSVLRCDLFTISPCTGTVQPGEAATIQVECSADNEGTYSEYIFIEIPDKTAEDSIPISIELIASVCAPVIDFSSVNTMFQECFLYEKMEDLEHSCDNQNRNAYVKGQNKLLFSNTCLGVSNIARLKIQNPGLVPSEVVASTKLISSSNAKNVKSSDPVFSVKPAKMSIPAYSTEYLEITFTPLQIAIFSGSLEVAMEEFSLKEFKFAVQLVGEGCVPIVSLIEPQNVGGPENTNLVFHPTLLGKKNVQKLVMQNSGIISCNVKIDTNNLDKEIFIMKATEETIPYLQIEDDDKIEDPETLSLSLSPGHKASFDVTFSPSDVGKFTGLIVLFIIGNPYEKQSISFIAECYIEDITLELPSIFLPGATNDEEEEKVCQYTLDFGSCYVDMPKHIPFKIYNHSQTSIYKFTFDDDKLINFTPNVGHIKPNSSKEITATVLSPQPKEIDKVFVECHLEKITYDDGIPEGTSWDSRLKVVHWKEMTEEMDPLHDFEVVESEKHDGYKYKVIESENEPPYVKVPNSSFAIPLQTSAIVAYTSYSCDVNYYEFPETLMFHSKCLKFMLSNTGTIPLTYNWNVVLDEHYPTFVESRSHSENSEIQSLSIETGSDTIGNQRLSPRETSKLSSPTKIFSRDQDTTSSNVGKKLYDHAIRGQDKDSVNEEEISTPTTPSGAQEIWTSSDPMPFTVTPSYGTIDPEKSEECTLIFSPLDILDFKVVVIAMIPHLDPNFEPLKIVVKGRGLLPLCYFKMEESDYLTSGRRDLSLPGPLGLNPGIPLHAETKVVEFKVIGIGGNYSKKIAVTNPTDESYNFNWENITQSSADTVSMFYCTPLKGNLEKESEIEVLCNFIAHDTGTFESFWNFVIPEHETKYHFLLVSHVSEPSTCFLASHVELCPTLIGISTMKYVSLINNENIPLKFQFDQDSFVTTGQPASLEINPMKGKIIPGEETPIKIQFSPKQPGVFQFHLKCHVKGMKKPLSLEVTAECYPVQPVVTYESEKNQNVTLSPSETNLIGLGEVSVKCPQNITFNITNIGKTAFYYYWQCDEQLLKRNKVKITFQSRGGHITAQSRVACCMTCIFLGKTNMSEFLISLQINKGPEYKIMLRGSSTRPNYEFSSCECNFGMCFFKEFKSFTYKKLISIKNNDVNPILIECMFENTSYFTLENANGPVSMNEEKTIFIIFTPQSLMKYEEVFEFLINGCTKQKFKITGEGIDIQVCLQNPQNKLILFSPVLPGGFGFACVPVINNSKCEVIVDFCCGKSNLESRYSSLEEEIQSILFERTTQTEIGSMFSPSPFEISPTSGVRMKPQEVINLCVKFKPTTRVKFISDKVYVKMGNYSEPLCILEGSCVGPDFSFDRYCVAFGAVLKGCSSPQKLKLINSGEVGARFKWESGEWNSMFQINPMKGYSSPDTETTFTIVFCPKELEHNVCHEAVCCIEDFNTLTLSLTGSCWQEPVPKENINFQIPVRTQETKSIPLNNKSSIPWDITPQVTGQYFSGPEKIYVPSHSSVQCDLTYAPLVMTESDTPHTGTAVFCIPEGQATAFNLIGVAEKPIASGKISKEIPCKENYTEILQVSNWLTTSQRFIVSNDVGKFEKFDPIVELSGNEYIDVPGKTEREYKWTVYCHKECTLNIKVSFTNIDTSEYIFYDMVIKVTKRGPLDTIKLITSVRQSVSHKIDLKNPLSTEVNYYMLCSVSDVHCRSPISVPANSKDIATIRYTPLFPGETTVLMDLRCTELGSFPYELELKALPPVPEKLLKCTAAIGSSVTVEANVTNMTKTKVDFACKIDNNDFETEKQITVSGNSKGSVSINFEPTSIGNISATLKVTSAIAGDFLFPLLGIAIAPTPQGPFSVKMGSSVNIPFRNVFAEKQTFTYSLDNLSFNTKNSSETIRPKKDTRIVVNFPKNLTVDLPTTGKLTVKSVAPNLSHIKWVFYVKGVDSN